MKGKALRRALQTSDSIRVNAEVPLITDTTELITPTIAQEMLKRNKANRPINWNKVEEYATAMADGFWRLHAQGIILDSENNILTGQKRLWAVVYSGVNVYMRVSRGNPPDTARLIDRGTPQSARDLASRDTGTKHTPTEASIARAFCALMGNTKPSVDVLGTTIGVISDQVAAELDELKGTKKTRAVLMICAAVCACSDTIEQVRERIRHVSAMADDLEADLAPQTADKCWGRGAAFGLAMDRASDVVRRRFGVKA